MQAEGQRHRPAEPGGHNVISVLRRAGAAREGVELPAPPAPGSTEASTGGRGRVWGSAHAISAKLGKGAAGRGGVGDAGGGAIGSPNTATAPRRKRKPISLRTKGAKQSACLSVRAPAVQPVTPFFQITEAPTVTAWPCSTRGSDSVLSEKPVLFQELEAILLSGGSSLDNARRCFARLIEAFSIYGTILTQLQAAYEEELRSAGGSTEERAAFEQQVMQALADLEAQQEQAQQQQLQQRQRQASLLSASQASGVRGGLMSPSSSRSALLSPSSSVMSLMSGSAPQPPQRRADTGQRSRLRAGSPPPLQQQASLASLGGASPNTPARGAHPGLLRNDSSAVVALLRGGGDAAPPAARSTAAPRPAPPRSGASHAGSPRVESPTVGGGGGGGGVHRATSPGSPQRRIGEGLECMAGFLQASGEGAGGDSHEAAVLVSQVRKLQRQLSRYKGEVVRLSGESVALRGTVESLEGIEKQYTATAAERNRLAEHLASMSLSVAKEVSLKEEALRDLAESQRVVAALRKAGKAGGPAPVSWWTKARLSMAFMNVRGPGVAEGGTGGGNGGGAFQFGHRLSGSMHRQRESVASDQGGGGGGGFLSAFPADAGAGPHAAAPPAPFSPVLSRAPPADAGDPSGADSSGSGSFFVIPPMPAAGAGPQEEGDPQAQPDLMSRLELWGIDGRETHPRDVIELLLDELGELSSRLSLQTLQAEGQLAAIANESRLARNLAVEDTADALSLRVFKPLGEPGWIPTYLHSMKPCFNMAFTLGNALQMTRDLHSYRRQGIRFEKFFADQGKAKGRSLGDVAYSFLHALHLYKQSPTCALMLMVVVGFMGVWAIDALTDQMSLFEDALRSQETGGDTHRRAAVFFNGILVKGKSRTLPDIMGCIDTVFSKTKDSRAILQLKHSAFVDGKGCSSMPWADLLSTRPSTDDATDESFFVTTLKTQWVNELILWLRKLDLALIGASDEEESPPQVSRKGAKSALAAADPLAPETESSTFVDRVFEASIAFSQGKPTPVQTTAPALWAPPPVMEAKSDGQRYDMLARLYCLDMGLRPAPCSGVTRHRQNPALDTMVVSEFLHFARHLHYIPSTYPMAASVPPQI